MCDALEPKNFAISELMWNLGGLRDKESRGETDDTLVRQRREVSLRLFVVSARLELEQGFVPV